MSQQLNRSPAIRTPDQRLRVFVSSTLAELAEERATVTRAISTLRLTPVLFELGARPHPPQELYRAYLAQSDIFIGIYWQRYGWVGPGMDISGVEDEFQLSQEMPRLLYMKTPAPEREERLTAMIGRLQTEATNSYRSFRSPRELGRLVREDLAILLSERFGGYSNVNSDAVADTHRAPGRARSLPSTTTTLVGREQEIVQVAELLQTPDVRLVTLTGPGGIGKTRLAVAVAESLAARYPMATVFVPLASIAEPGLVVPRVAEALGASLEGSGRPLDALVEHLGDTPMLLVLDNLEQVVGVGPDLDDLLTRCPGLKFLATSRTVLRLRAEHEYPVGALTVPAFREIPTLDQLLSLPAVELFVDRARSVRRDFALKEDNAVAVAEICRRLDGLPLGIELAAARVRLLDPPALLARLESRLDFLGTGPVDLPERQRTLRGTIDWSVDLLSDAEKEMLAGLSVFVDGWSLEAATSVSGLDEDRTLDLIDALAGHSLVNIIAGDSGPRFRMLETVREFAAELLATSPASADTQMRHAAYFKDFAESSAWPATDETEWAERLQGEEGNLRQAVRWFFTNDIAPLPHLLRILWRFWQLRDRMSDGRAWLEELLPRIGSLDDSAQAEAWLTAAMTAAEVGDDDGALLAAEEVERFLGRVDDAYLRSASQLALSWARPITDDFDGALQAASASLEGFRRLNEPFMAANAVFSVGMIEKAMGRHEAARQHLNEVHMSRGRLANSWLVKVACVQLASLAVEAGRLDDARSLLEESADETEGTERGARTLSFRLIAYARLLLAEGNLPRAVVALGAADGLRDRVGLRPWPMARSDESTLHTRLRAAVGPGVFEEALAAGSRFSRLEADALLQGE